MESEQQNRHNGLNDVRQADKITTSRRSTLRILVISRQKFPIPMEQMPVLIQAFADWRARYRPVLEAFEFFAGGGGGFGIANIADEAALNQMLLEYPLGPSNELEVRPVIDGDVALAQWLATMQAMAGGAGPR